MTDHLDMDRVLEETEARDTIVRRIEVVTLPREGENGSIPRAGFPSACRMR